VRWGLVPYWWKKTLKELPATFNARAETVETKPMFRDACAEGHEEDCREGRLSGLLKSKSTRIRIASRDPDAGL